MHLIALLTDFGLEDGFVGTVKGVIKSINSRADIVDISHNITPFDIMEGALVLRASYSYFPEGTVFVAVVDPGVGTERRPVAVKTSRYYFVAPDNGILSPVLKKEKPEKIIHLTEERFFLQRINETFHGRDIFAPVAAHLSRGVPIEEMGREISSLVELDIPVPQKEGGYLVGQIIKFDRFGNGITNIEEIPPFEEIVIKNYRIDRICRNFLEGDSDRPNIIRGSFGFYEVFVPRASAKEKFGLKLGDLIKIKLKG
ncbi:SAM hydrolase/SAM-dependent halogenase family protein [Persephonella sp.]|nr:SAM-dependent chlorinase/fluorinase [Aquificota bacterium]